MENENVENVENDSEVDLANDDTDQQASENVGTVSITSDQAEVLVNSGVAISFALAVIIGLLSFGLFAKGAAR